jgi:hypothetical protein
MSEFPVRERRVSSMRLRDLEGLVRLALNARAPLDTTHLQRVPESRQQESEERLEHRLNIDRVAAASPEAYQRMVLLTAMSDNTIMPRVKLENPR